MPPKKSKVDEPAPAATEPGKKDKKKPDRKEKKPSKETNGEVIDSEAPSVAKKTKKNEAKLESAESKPKVAKKRKTPEESSSSPSNSKKVKASPESKSSPVKKTPVKKAAEKKPKAKKADGEVKEKKPKKADSEVKEKKPKKVKESDSVTVDGDGSKKKKTPKKSKAAAPAENGVDKPTKAKKSKKEKSDSTGDVKIDEKDPAIPPKPAEAKEKAKKEKKPKKLSETDDEVGVVQHRRGFLPKPMAAATLLKKVIKKRTAKSKVVEEEETESVEDVPDSEEVPDKKSKSKTKPLQNKSQTNWDEIDFRIDKDFKLKIASWNVSGLRAWLDKGGRDYVMGERPDILCLQETKCKTEDIPESANLLHYHPYWLGFGGHAGIATYSRQMPLNVNYGLGDEELDGEARMMTVEYEKFFLINVYVPNSGRKLVTLPKRLRWNELFQKYVKDLDKKKPVIICGDMNVAHSEIDLANPKSNTKNAGFTKEEREGMTEFLKSGFVDSFRQLYPDVKGAYTFWTYMGGARAKNVGWRLDYVICSERLAKNVVEVKMRPKVFGSDHCPIVGFFNI